MKKQETAKDRDKKCKPNFTSIPQIPQQKDHKEVESSPTFDTKTFIFRITTRFHDQFIAMMKPSWTFFVSVHININLFL